MERKRRKCSSEWGLRKVMLKRSFGKHGGKSESNGMLSWNMFYFVFPPCFFFLQKANDRVLEIVRKIKSEKDKGDGTERDTRNLKYVFITIYSRKIPAFCFPSVVFFACGQRLSGVCRFWPAAVCVCVRSCVHVLMYVCVFTRVCACENLSYVLILYVIWLQEKRVSGSLFLILDQVKYGSTLHSSLRALFESRILTYSKWWCNMGKVLSFLISCLFPHMSELFGLLISRFPPQIYFFTCNYLILSAVNIIQV